MIKYLYSYYNTVAGHYQNACINEFSLMDPEALKGYIEESTFYCKPDDLVILKDCDVYLLGKFDTKTGEIETCKEFLLHMSEVVQRILASKGVENGGN